MIPVCTRPGHRHGAVLILSVGIIVLMLTLATSFLLTVSPQRGSGETQALDRIALIATHSGRDRAITALLDDYATLEFTSHQGRWRHDFKALAGDGLPVSAWEDEPWNSPRRAASTDSLVNIQVRDPFNDGITNMLRTFGAITDADYSGERIPELLGSEDDVQRSYAVTRYHNLQYLDRSYRPSTAVAGTYVVRFAVEILDTDGHLRANPDYPDIASIASLPSADPTLPVDVDGTPPRHPWHPDAVLGTDHADYLRYRAYLTRFARSTASMHGTREARATNLFPYAKGFDPNDVEPVEYLANGAVASNLKSALGKGYRFGEGGHRTSAAGLFKGEVLRWEGWANSFSNAYSELAHLGRAYTPGTVMAAFSSDPGGSGSPSGILGGGLSLNTRVLSPFGGGLRDQDWVNDAGFTHARSESVNGSTRDAPNVPWRVNLLTMPLRVREQMLFGMSSLVRWEEKMNGGRSSAYDLLGSHYPDPFPLSLDDGRDVPFIGADGSNGLASVTWSFGFGDYSDPAGDLFHASRNSYWLDTMLGLAKTIEVAQYVWNRGWDPANAVIANAAIHDAGSLLDPLSTDPTVIQTAIEAEWMRIIGEDLANPGNGLLNSRRSGLPVAVGYGSGRRDGRVEAEANTRAMEYLLNDLRMSYFGSPALNFDGDDNNRDGRIDSDDAESTVNGWWHNNERTWSWWYTGIDRVENPANAWLERATWIRFWHGESRISPAYRAGARNRLARWDGERWEEFVEGDSEFDLLLAINSPFLRHPRGQAWSATHQPVKPWSATGRLFVGRSKLWTILVRGQVYDQLQDRKASEVNAEYTFAILPDRSGSIARSRVVYTRHHVNMQTR